MGASVHQGLIRHLYVPQHTGQIGSSGPSGPGGAGQPKPSPVRPTPRRFGWWGLRPHHTGAMTNPIALRHPFTQATQTGGQPPLTNPIALRVAAHHAGHIPPMTNPIALRLQQTGQYAASSSGGDQQNYQPTGGDTGGGATTPSGVVDSLLGSLGGILGGGGAGGGSSQVQTQQAAPPQSWSNVIAPGQNAPAPGPAPAPAPHPSTTIVPATTPKSHLLWWIVGGVAAAGLILIAWRMFGHKGAKIAGMSAAKAAAYYRWR